MSTLESLPPTEVGSDPSPANAIDTSRRVPASPLPCRVVLARTNEQLMKAVALRAEAYSRHAPSLGDQLSEPETIDTRDDVLVFLAESKEDGSAVGTLRVQTNKRGTLALENSVTLPERFHNRPLVGVTRLAVKDGRAGRNVKLVLFKALFRYCFATQIEWILIAARPPLDTEYRKIGFVDVFNRETLVPIRTASNIPHFVLSFDVLSAERNWHECNHRLYNFMALDYHPEIEVFSSLSGMWSRPRRSPMQSTIVQPSVPLTFPLV